MSIELTNTQKGILEFIINQKADIGIPPSLIEIAEKFGYRNKSTVRQHLQAIEKKGYIKRTSKKARSIELTLEEKMFVPKPVLGEVAAGNPLTIYPDSIDMVSLPSVARMPKESFLLRVKGDSLKDAYIFNGDLVIVDPNKFPKDGDFTVAILDDASVVKRYFEKGSSIELHSENPEYETIVVEKSATNFKVVGVVIGVYRSIEKKVV